MRLLILYTHTNNCISLVQKCVVVVAKVACLVGAARGHILGISIEHEFFAFEITQFNFVSILVLAKNLR